MVSGKDFSRFFSLNMVKKEKKQALRTENPGAFFFGDVRANSVKFLTKTPKSIENFCEKLYN